MSETDKDNSTIETDLKPKAANGPATELPIGDASDSKSNGITGQADGTETRDREAKRRSRRETARRDTLTKARYSTTAASLPGAVPSHPTPHGQEASNGMEKAPRHSEPTREYPGVYPVRASKGRISTKFGFSQTSSSLAASSAMASADLERQAQPVSGESEEDVTNVSLEPSTRACNVVPGRRVESLRGQSGLVSAGSVPSIHSAIEAEVYDASAHREEVRLAAERNAEELLLASAVSANVKVVDPNEDEDISSKWKLYAGLAALVVVAVVVVLFLVLRDNGGDDSGVVRNTDCINALRLFNFSSGTVEGQIVKDVEGTLEDSCVVENSNAFTLWYSLEGDGSFLSASTCQGTDLSRNSDTQVLVFSGSCDALQCVGGSDQLCGSHGSVGWLAADGEDYFLVVKGFRLSNEGNFTLTLDQMVQNEECEASIDVNLTESPFFGSTRNRTTAASLPSCDDSDSVFSTLWYKLEGDGSRVCVSVSIEEEGSEDFQLDFGVYEGASCSQLNCIQTESVIQNLQENTTSFVTDVGVEYFISVKNTGKESEGDFILDISSVSADESC